MPLLGKRCKKIRVHLANHGTNQAFLISIHVILIPKSDDCSSTVFTTSSELNQLFENEFIKYLSVESPIARVSSSSPRLISFWGRIIIE